MKSKGKDEHRNEGNSSRTSPMSTIHLYVILFLILLCARNVQAEINCGVTLEWLADTCPYVGLYSALTVSRETSGSIHVSAALETSLRGEPPKTCSFKYPTFSRVSQRPARAPEVGDKFLIFLRDADTRPKEIRWEHIISVTHPSVYGSEHVALRPDFTLLTDGNQILKVVKDRIGKEALTPTPWREYPRDRFRVEVPVDTPVFSAIFRGSSCYLIVPDDLLEVCENARKKMGRSAGDKRGFSKD